MNGPTKMLCGCLIFGWWALGTIFADEPSPLPNFKMQEIATDLKIGYAVHLADVNSDGKVDVVVVDQHRLMWYQNPTWKRRTITSGKMKADNVCLAVIDLENDGEIEFVLGAGWKPSDTKTAGTLHVCKRGKSLDSEWQIKQIPCEEPTVHRLRVADLNGDGKKWLVLAPLQGREATKAGNYRDGRPVNIVAYQIPKTFEGEWKSQVLSQSLHVVHNFCEGNWSGFARPGACFLTASYEGISLIYPEGKNNRWSTRLIHEGNQQTPQANRGASEIKQSQDRFAALATIEPWHGHQVVVYHPGKPDPRRAFNYERVVVDEQLRWGHALAFADLNNDKIEELIVGVRDDPRANDTLTERRGVRVYQRQADQSWKRTVLEKGGVAVEDLAVGDLNGDGYLDIVAVGRATGNLRLYWNQGKK